MATFAARLVDAMPEIGSLDVARDYVARARRGGVVRERDVAELCLLMAEADRRGLTREIGGVLDDPTAAGTLKVYRLRHALGDLS